MEPKAIQPAPAQSPARDLVRNFRSALDAFAMGYHKSVVLTAVTVDSLAILDDSMERIGSSLATVVSAFEEIRATSASTAGNSSRIDSMMADILRKNEGMNADIETRVREIVKASDNAGTLASLFQDIQAKTEAVAGITGAIQDVSDRTGILAINASIEAARAGNVGRGFRIIANEVRTLAQQTGEFAKQIDTNIGEFRKSVDAVSERMDGFLDLLRRFHASFTGILDAYRENSASVNQAGEFLSEISLALKEENLALTDGLKSLEGISHAAKDTHAVFGALQSSYRYLDTLLSRGERL
ncbi:MAG TPA: methyl-accepting chemotaxis protein [Magnetospirillaceae bacterium]|nr:methyl-accepting chemotaxis protein [Magnetospirillaceae bacterium]